MRFLADQNIANSTIGIVKNLGYHIETLKEHRMQEAADQEVIEFAVNNNLVLITYDQDFTSIINYPPHSHSGVIVLRVPSELPKLVNKVLEEFLTTVSFDLSKRLVILESNRFRIRE